MRRYSYGNFLKLFLYCTFGICANAIIGSGDRASSAEYVFSDNKKLPDISLSYDPHVVRFQTASASMIAADLGKGNSWGFSNAPGKSAIRHWI